MNTMIQINRDLSEQLASLYIETEKFDIKIFLQNNELFLFKENCQIKSMPFTVEGVEFLISYINAPTKIDGCVNYEG